MKKTKTLTKEQAMVQFLTMLRIWSYNINELRAQSKSNDKILEMLQSLDEAVAAIGSWAMLDGSIQLIVAYQPTMFEIDDFEDHYTGSVPY